MRRDDEIIVFDPLDRSRYPGLPKFVPIEGVPDLFEKLTIQEKLALQEKDEAQSLDVMDIPESQSQHKLAVAHRRLHDLGIVKSQLGVLAPDEIAASIPVEVALGIPGELPVRDLDQE